MFDLAKLDAQATISIFMVDYPRKESLLGPSLVTICQMDDLCCISENQAAA